MAAPGRLAVLFVALAVIGVSLISAPTGSAQPEVTQTAEAEAAAAQTAAAEQTATAEQSPPSGQQIQGDLQVQGDIQVEGDQQVAGDQFVTTDATSTPLDPAMVLALVLVLLLVALFTLSEIFRYLRDGREDYYRTFREFARKGVYLAPVMVNATATQSVPSAEAAFDPNAPPVEQTFEMSGPGSLFTGDKATYTARLGGQPALGTDWRLVDANDVAIPTQSATLEPAADGASATLTAAKAGAYIVSASPQGNPGLKVRSEVTVVDPQPADGGEIPTLPFIGQGYGSIVGAILLLAVVVVLAATRAIDADIVGVLLGSIAGYLFGVGISRNTS